MQNAIRNGGKVYCAGIAFIIHFHTTPKLLVYLKLTDVFSSCFSVPHNDRNMELYKGLGWKGP